MEVPILSLLKGSKTKLKLSLTPIFGIKLQFSSTEFLLQAIKAREIKRYR